MQFLQTVLVHSMWNYDPANYWICSLYDIQLFRFLFFFICVETPRGRCSIFHWFKLQNKSASLVLLIRLDYFLLRRMLLHQSAATVSVDCIVVRHFRKLSHSVVSGLNSHSRCSHTPSTNAIGHSVCGFSLHDSKKATATPSKPPPPRWPSAEILGKTLLGLKEWFVWNAEQMKRMRLILFQAGDAFSYVYIWTYIPNYLRVDWLWYTWSEARYTAINVRPFLHARTSSSLCP